MAHPITVFVVGGTGRAGSTIVDALLARQDEFVRWHQRSYVPITTLTQLARKSSLQSVPHLPINPP